MRHKKLILLVFIFIFIMAGSGKYAQAVGYKSESVHVGSSSKSVNYIYFHPSEQLELKPVLAQGRVGKTESLQSMAARNQAIAAVNGTFFNAYDQSDLQPMGNIMINNNMVHYRGGPTTVGITADNYISFLDSTNIKIYGGINGSREWPNNWYAWFINHVPSSAQEIVIFTPSFRETQLKFPGFTFIVVANSKVITINTEQASIPSNGFVIAYGSSEQNRNMISRFKIGDSVEYWIEFPDYAQNLLHTLSAGPKLLTQGRVDVDFVRENISDPKLVSSAGQRSFIGYQADGTILIGTVNNATIYELAAVAAKLGLKEAMNLDGGASSGLYYNGKYLTSPGRNLSNSLVLVPKKRIPAVVVNGNKIVFTDAAPYIDSGTTMVPLRGVFEALGAEIEWINETSTVVARRGDTTIILNVGKSWATINGSPNEMLKAPVNKNGRVYVPLRFISEALNSNVAWNQQSYTVIINSSN